jgi:transposase
MLTVEDFLEIRQARRDGLTVRQLADQFGHSSKTILKALADPQPQPYSITEPRPAPVFGPYRELVDAILQADASAPPKQRHTAAQIYRRLRDEHGYQGGYDQIRRYLQARRREHRETFIPLDHPPGHRAEADFGHIHVDLPDGRVQVPVLLVTWSYSNCPFALALPTERTEAILHGLVEAFTFFGCVPRELWWDNPRTVVRQLWTGRERALHPRYAALASHYTFAPKFCLPAKGNEKPRVEHRVFDLQRRWATPVPQILGLGALNEHLLRQCLAERDRVSGDHAETVGVRFERDRQIALPVPARRFDACVLQAAAVDKYQTVRFDGNGYSVPRRWAFRPVTVKGYVDRIEVVAEGQVVAAHPRSYGRGERVLDPLHYLVTLERKPAALDHAPVYRDWQLPAAFGEFRQTLERRFGPRAGARQFIRVLQLLALHPLTRVEQAIRQCRPDGDAAAVIAGVERLARDAGAVSEAGHVASDMPLSVNAAHLAAVWVPAPDLSQFDRLLSQTCKGDQSHDATDGPLAAGQPETTEAAHRAGRVRETGSRSGGEQRTL